MDYVLSFYFRQLKNANVDYNQEAINNLVSNIQSKQVDDNEIYHEIEESFPLFGCPLTFYVDNYEEDDIAKSAKAVQRNIRKEASQATVRAGTELDNKRRCI